MSGRAERRFEAVREAFAQVLTGQAGTGAAVAAWWDGAWVVDLWGGWADAAATRPCDPAASCSPIRFPTVRGHLRTGAGRSRPTGAGCAGAALVATVQGPYRRPATAVSPGRRGSAGRTRSHCGVLRLGLAVLAAGRTRADMGTGDRTRRVCAVLRPSHRRVGPPRRRARAGAFPPRGGMRPAGHGVLLRAYRGRASQGGRSDRRGTSISGSSGRPGCRRSTGGRWPTRPAR